jgi:hypothetical protein
VINVNEKFGRLLVVQVIDKKMVRCVCDCGEIVERPVCRLKIGKTRSCGCLARELKRRPHSHGECTAKNKSPEYRVWGHINGRCHNPSDAAFSDYGGRGICVADEWRNSFAAFLAHVGRRPSKLHTLDRINNDGNYEPGNVRWATRIEQNNNRRSNRRLEFDGQVKTLAEWGRAIGIDSLTIWARIYAHGWTVERALTTPLRGTKWKEAA